MIEREHKTDSLVMPIGTMYRRVPLPFIPMIFKVLTTILILKLDN